MKAVQKKIEEVVTGMEEIKAEAGALVQKIQEEIQQVLACLRYYRRILNIFISNAYREVCF